MEFGSWQDIPRDLIRIRKINAFEARIRPEGLPVVDELAEVAQQALQLVAEPAQPAAPEPAAPQPPAPKILDQVLPDWAHPSLAKHCPVLTDSPAPTRYPYWGGYNVISFLGAERFQIRKTFLINAIACGIHRRTTRSNTQGTDEDAEIGEGHLNLSQLHSQHPFELKQASCVYTYLHLTWKNLINSTKRHVRGIGQYESFVDGACTMCSSRSNDEINDLANLLCGLVPEGLSNALRLPLNLDGKLAERYRVAQRAAEEAAGSPTDIQREYWDAHDFYGKSLHSLIHGAYILVGGETEVWGNILQKIMPTAGEFAEEGMQEGGNLVWKVMEEKLGEKMRGEDWIHEWYGRRNNSVPKRHEKWRFEPLTLRGWVFWDDERVVKMGWNDIGVISWLVAKEPTGFNEDDNRAEVERCGKLIMGEPSENNSSAAIDEGIWFDNERQPA
ncbi:hypothetical protein B0T21DRAFT_453016 [Apiosordaria backusii]|uniref:Uncharacterized protein n=1 Tax=Apiosordaria backusii TaxID=314023 RepID=A0AA40B2M8_9PEZI|nr:hypothetical protein B0T21DRAFT_453016 [Apiosordaria backusii]